MRAQQWEKLLWLVQVRRFLGEVAWKQSPEEKGQIISAFYYLITCSFVIQQVLYSLVGGKDK